MGGVPVVPTVNLHALPSFAVLCQTMNFVRKERGDSGLISFATYSWNRILRPPDLGLPCVGWYRAYLEIRSPSGLVLHVNLTFALFSVVCTNCS